MAPFLDYYERSNLNILHVFKFNYLIYLIILTYFHLLS